MSFSDDLKFLMTAVPAKGEFRPTWAEFVEMHSYFFACGFRKTHEPEDIAKFARFALVYCSTEGKAVGKDVDRERDYTWMGSYQNGMNDVRNRLQALRRDAVEHEHNLMEEACEQRAWDNIGIVCAHYIAMRLRLR